MARVKEDIGIMKEALREIRESVIRLKNPLPSQAKKGEKEERQELKCITALFTFKNKTEEEIKPEAVQVFESMKITLVSSLLTPMKEIDNLENIFYLPSPNFERAKRRELKLRYHGDESFGAYKWWRQHQTWTWLTAEGNNEGKGKHGPLRYQGGRTEEAHYWGKKPPISSSNSHLEGKVKALASEGRVMMGPQYSRLIYSEEAVRKGQERIWE
ncbi:uncharacterized protein G2W53_039378 [Senna tora]|uniref:Uncharacterized protein n=1 Tax=Senna tora TaxID=362788 RepID=A0A834W2S5_9FABA|nr:uncharacterized protein G2W53_039378 [Senna tora]